MKMMMRVLVVFTCTLLFAAYAAECDVKEIVARIPDHERADFVREHLQIGYELIQQALKYGLDEKTLADFAIALYKLSEEPLHLDERRKECWICFPPGSDNCIDACDIGVHPINRV